MNTTTISIPLDPKTADIYRSASVDDKKKLQVLLSLWLREYEKPSKPLGELMDEISKKAQERGLTPTILESILNDK